MYTKMKIIKQLDEGVPLLSLEELANINVDLRDPIDYRKSGLSLNDVIGCPLDCAYCVRHLFDNFNMRNPKAIMTDDDAVRALIKHKFFQPNVTPLQLFNRATDPFLPQVKQHTFRILRLLDNQNISNHVLLITRYHVKDEDCHFLNTLTSLRVSVLVTYSGIDDSKIEPINSAIAEESLRTLYKNSNRYKVIMYWRPIIPGINDSELHIKRVIEIAKNSHAVATTGLFFRQQMAAYFDNEGIPKPYNEVARRKILPKVQEERVLHGLVEARLLDKQVAPIFRKTSCAISYAHKAADYNGHYGIQELCDICPENQKKICSTAWRIPDIQEVAVIAGRVGITQTPIISKRAITFRAIPEQERYYVQHSLGFQCHDSLKPHHRYLHGRANIGWDIINNEVNL